MATTKVRKHRKLVLRKIERAYARSISLREDQIKRIEEAGVKNVSELFQKLVDDWLLTRDKEEAAKLRERADLLTYKWRVLTTEEGQKEAKEGQAQAVIHEAQELRKKADEIERNIKAGKV
jgi:hypothetical protein